METLLLLVSGPPALKVHIIQLPPKPAVIRTIPGNELATLLERERELLLKIFRVPRRAP
jgi:hypothetical protein